MRNQAEDGKLNCSILIQSVFAGHKLFKQLVLKRFLRNKLGIYFSKNLKVLRYLQYLKNTKFVRIVLSHFK